MGKEDLMILGVLAIVFGVIVYACILQVFKRAKGRDLKMTLALITIIPIVGISLGAYLCICSMWM